MIVYQRPVLTPLPSFKIARKFATPHLAPEVVFIERTVRSNFHRSICSKHVHSRLMLMSRLPNAGYVTICISRCGAYNDAIFQMTENRARLAPIFHVTRPILIAKTFLMFSSYRPLEVGQVQNLQKSYAAAARVLFRSVKAASLISIHIE
jgi:hypothetical protein